MNKNDLKRFLKSMVGKRVNILSFVDKTISTEDKSISKGIIKAVNDNTIFLQFEESEIHLELKNIETVVCC